MFRSIRFLLFSLVLLVAATSCEKEVSLENGADQTGGSQSGTAVFVQDGAPGLCVTPLISGDYVVGTALNNSNSVVVTVNVTTVGTYVISTGLINGMQFVGDGTFATTGPQNITLFGTGTPVSAITSSYVPGVTGCSFLITATTSVINPVTNAVGTLDCSTSTNAGVYTQSVPLSSANTVTIPVNVTTAGSYSITTTTTNGCTFSGTGTLAVGAQNIVLTGSGTPVNLGAVSFPVTFGTSNCSFSITFLPAPPPAVYTFTGAPGACAPISVDGDYPTGSPLTAANTASIEVNVTTAGLYTITTNTVNGITFSRTGQFTATGPQTLVLTGSGTPSTVGSSTFTVGTGGCTFDVNVTAPSSPCTGLVDGKFVLVGQFTLNGFSFGIATGTGTFQATIQESPLQLDVFFPGDTPPAPGTYTIGSVTMHSLYIAGVNAVDWNATAGTVYVSTNGSGDTIIEFCNINFTGTQLTGGPNLTSTGSGKMVL